MSESQNALCLIKTWTNAQLLIRIRTWPFCPSISRVLPDDVTNVIVLVFIFRQQTAYEEAYDNAV